MLRLPSISGLCLLGMLCVSGLVRPLVADDVPVLVSAEPVAILQWASLDRALEDIDFLLTAGDVPQYSQVLRGFLAGLNNLDGVDRSRPLGGMLFLDPANPSRDPLPLLYLPVTDVAALRATVMATGNALEPTASPLVFDLRLGSDHLNLLIDGGYGFIVDPAKAPPAFRTETLTRLIETERTEFDATLTLRRAGLPPVQIERAVSELTQEAARQLARRDGESAGEHALRLNLEGRVYELLGLVLGEGLEVSAGVHLGSGSPLSLAVEFRTEPEGELQPLLQQSLAVPSQLPTGDAQEPALSWRAAIDLSPRGRDIGRQLLALAREQLQHELGERVPDVVRRQVDGAFAALDKTVGNGRLETRIEFLPTDTGRFVLLAGTAVQQAESLDEAARTLLPLAQQAGDLKRVTLDDFTAAGLQFHRIEGQGARERDRRLYGADLSLYLAAGADAVWLAVGGRTTPAALDRALTPVLAEDATIDAAQLRVRLWPWIDFALREGVAEDPRLAELARNMLTRDAAITAGLHASDRGVRAAVVVDEAYVRFLVRLIVIRIKGN